MTDNRPPTAKEVADSAREAVTVQQLQAAVRLIDNLIGLVKWYSRADAGKPDREAMMAELNERADIHRRHLAIRLNENPSLDVNRMFRLDDEKPDATH